MKYIFLTLILFTGLFSIKLNAQTNKNNNLFIKKIELKLNYSNVNSRQIIPDYTSSTPSLIELIYKKNPQYNFEALYGLNKFISVGIYFGYANGTLISNKITDFGPNYYISSTKDRFGKSIFYGIESNIQLLPLFLKSDKLRFNVYCPVRIGFVSQNITNLDTYVKTWDAPVLEYGAGLGVAYYFTKNLGVFGEYQIGHFYNNRNTQWKAGIVFKL